MGEASQCVVMIVFSVLFHDYSSQIIIPIFFFFFEETEFRTFKRVNQGCKISERERERVFPEIALPFIYL